MDKKNLVFALCMIYGFVVFPQRYILFYFKDGKPGTYDTTLQKMSYQGEKYFFSGKYDSANFIYNKLAEIKPGKYQLYYDLSVSYVLSGELSNASRTLKLYMDSSKENCHCSFIELNKAFSPLKG
jgi:hypothetical protein